MIIYINNKTRAVNVTVRILLFNKLCGTAFVLIKSNKIASIVRCLILRIKRLTIDKNVRGINKKDENDVT